MTEKEVTAAIVGAQKALAPLITRDCAVLFKASRGMALETLIEF